MKQTIVRIVTAVLLLNLLPSVGCSDKVSTQKDKAEPKMANSPATAGVKQDETVQKTILRYNQLLVEGYRNLNMTQLQEVATLDQSRKAYYHMAALTEGKTRMNSTLKKTDFIKTEFPQAEKCQVQTREVWDFYYSDIQSGKKGQGVEDYVYNVHYTLEKKDGRWIITDIIANGEESDDKKLPSWKGMFNHEKPAGKPHRP
jgi:hypothetical protein